MPPRTGPLVGLRVVEMSGLGPAPLAAMLLADLGADVVRVDRLAAGDDAARAAARRDVVNRGKRSIAVDLKSSYGGDVVERLAGVADVLLEGFRPGVMERLGLGPDRLTDLNPRLVYGRMTGWGQDGPLAEVAGHDIGYLAVTGALWATGRAESPPPPPLNLVGDYAGGSMFLVMGVLAALHERSSSGRGQVVDAAMVDGVSVLGAMFTSLRGLGLWRDEREANLLDGGAPFYDTYRCADGRYLAIGALEPAFYRELVERSGFRADRTGDERFDQGTPATWPALKVEWAAHIATRTRDEWAELLAGFDTCAQPVLEWAEAPQHPHLAARSTYVDSGGITQPAPAPRLTRTPAAIDALPCYPGEHTAEVLAELGLTGSAPATAPPRS